MGNRVDLLTKDRLGRLEQRFLAYAQLRRMTTVHSGQLRAPLALNAAQERKVLSRLARAGTIVRLKRGTYLFPPRLPVGGVWNPGEYVILRELMKVSREGRYQLCGWQTFNRHGFTEQVPAQTYVYNNRISGRRSIAGQMFTFIKVSDERLGGTGTVRTPDGVEVPMPTKARALMDAVCDWSRFGSLPMAYEWIRSAVRAERRLADELANSACRHGNQGTIRRIGFILDHLGARGSWKRALQRALRRSTSLIPLVPSRPLRGAVDRRWGIVANE
jgi:predicted transcriptional regulator of viral defense system